MPKNHTLQSAHLIASIHELFSSDERLLEFFFHHKHFELRLPQEELLMEALQLRPSEWILIKLAMDFWDGSGKTTVNELLRMIDDETLMTAMEAIQYYREI